MTDRPIIFSAPMVRALLEGRKTQTRRLAWRDDKEIFDSATASPWQRVKPGDRLWVRENWAISSKHNGPRIVYAADGESRQRTLSQKWVPSIHMPRKHSRLTLVVTAVKIERLQDISEDDARAEGIYLGSHHGIFQADPTKKNMGPFEGRTAQEGFANLWCEIHGQDSWSANPFVVALTFTVHKANIDLL